MLVSKFGAILTSTYKQGEKMYGNICDFAKFCTEISYVKIYWSKKLKFQHADKIKKRKKINDNGRGQIIISDLKSLAFSIVWLFYQVATLLYHHYQHGVRLIMHAVVTVNLYENPMITTFVMDPTTTVLLIYIYMVY